MGTILRRGAYIVGGTICLISACQVSPRAMLGAVPVYQILLAAALGLIAMGVAESLPALVKRTYRQPQALALAVWLVGGVLLLGPLLVLFFSCLTAN